MYTCRRGLCNKSEETEKGDWIGLDDVIYHDEVPHVICMYVICVILFGAIESNLCGSAFDRN